MALRQVILGKKIEQARTELGVLCEKDDNFRERRERMEAREAELAAAMDEVTAETPEEDKAALESEVDAFSEEGKALEEEEKSHNEQKAAIEKKISDLQKELSDIDARSALSITKAQKREDEKPMENREFFGMTTQERDTLFARSDVKEFLLRLRSAGREKRAISGAELLIPDVLLGVIREQAAEASKLMKHVSLRVVPGTSRATVAGAIPEAVWTEMCAKLNELAISFTNIELDGYKVGGFIPVCNALLEDSDISLASEIVTALGRAIGLALDKAILYGTGTKMPLGIVTRLAQTTKPTDYPATSRPWVALSATNLIAVSGKTGIELFKAIATASGAASSKYASGPKFWAMNEATKLKLMVEAMSFNASGAIVTGQQNAMPVIGGAIETLEFIPDDMIIGGYGELYVLAQRAGTQIAQSEHYRFTDDVTVFKGTARYDGMPVIAEAFVGIGIGGTAPAADDVTFAEDEANP